MIAKYNKDHIKETYDTINWLKDQVKFWEIYGNADTRRFWNEKLKDAKVKLRKMLRIIPSDSHTYLRPDGTLLEFCDYVGNMTNSDLIHIYANALTVDEAARTEIRIGRRRFSGLFAGVAKICIITR